MASSPSHFVWYELMTTDVPAAQRFYSEAVGWQVADAGMPGMDYLLLSTEHGMVGGLMALPADAQQAGGRPGWLGYVAVDDVDAAAARAQSAGSTLCHGPADIPGVGRFASITDPQGAALVLFKGSAEAPAAPPPGAAGHIGWHELYATELAPAFDFYATQFGWRATDAMDMGAMGTYQMFATGSDGEPVGGMMKRPPEMPATAWLYYINVTGVDAAMARITAQGGQVLMGPQEVPGGSWIAQCLDPQGAMFAIVGPKN
jgi:uncharacterized protein